MAHDQEAMMAGVVTAIDGSAVGTDVGNRVYRTLAPPDATEPFVLINLVADVPDRYFSSASDIQALIDITLWGDKGSSETTLQAINKKLLALDGSAVTISGYNGGQLVVEDRGAIETEDQRVSIRSSWRLFATSQ